MSKRLALHLAAIGAGLTLCSAFGLATAAGVVPAGAPNGADGFPILYATATQNQAHVCKVIGKDKYGNQAIVCVNLTAIPIADEASPLPYAAVAQAVVSCQNSSDVTVQCANITETAELADAEDGVQVTASNHCGHAWGACPVGALSAQTGRVDYALSNSCGDVPGSAYDAWGLVLGGGATVIELPTSDTNVTLDSSNANDGSNFSTGHNYICY
jgi:hypothetical protein